jgi:hypothetical protein
MWMLREIERIHLHNCYNIPDYTFMDYNISDITSKHAEEIHWHSTLQIIHILLKNFAQSSQAQLDNPDNKANNSLTKPIKENK